MVLMKSMAVRLVLVLLAIPPTAFAQTTNTQLVDMVTRMAKIGRASSPTFSPGGRQLAYVSERTGVPQVCVTAVYGGAPVKVTKGDDAMSFVIWWPAGAWLAM